MDLQTVEQADALIVQVMEDRIDAASAIRFKDRMRGLLGELQGQRVILDLSRVQFLDSSGLGAVVAVMKMLAPDRVLELAGPTAGVAKVFRLTRMDRVFRIHASLPRAEPPPPAPGPAHAG